MAKQRNEGQFFKSLYTSMLPGDQQLKAETPNEDDQVASTA